MPYRVRSTDVWFNMPGVVAAYQSIAAPDSFAARQNVGNDLRFAGCYTSANGVQPGWSPSYGWRFNGVDQYLSTGVIPRSGFTCAARFSNRGNLGPVWGTADDTAWARFYFGAEWINESWNLQAFGAGADMQNWGYHQALSAGVAVVSGQYLYVNGNLRSDACSGWTTTTTADVWIARLTTGVASTPYGLYDVQSFALFERPFSPAAIWQMSRQMAYSEQNPDWNAWSRRRRYYCVYAPPVIETGSALAAAGGAFGTRFAGPPHGAHSGPRRPAGPIGGHRGKLND